MLGFVGRHGPALLCLRQNLPFFPRAIRGTVYRLNGSQTAPDDATCLES